MADNEWSARINLEGSRKYYPGILLEKLRETLKFPITTAGTWVEIRNRDLQNTGLKRYNKLTGYIK
jgi:hypothetical protein